MSRYPSSRAAQPAKQMVNVVDYLARLEPDFKAALTEQRMLWAKEFEYAKQALSKNKLLRETAEQGELGLASFRAAIINVAAVGISLNPIKKQAFLVPRGRLVCLDISYQGLIDLAVDAGSILWAEARLVYSKDIYKNLGVEHPPQHDFTAFGDRGELVGAYALAKRHDGTYHVMEMTAAEIEQIKKQSGNTRDDSPWVVWFEQMCLKAVVKRAAKWWPKVGERFQAAVQMLNDQEGNAVVIDHDAPPPTDSETLNLLLEHDDSPMVDGRTVETWIIDAVTGEDFARARELVRALPEGPTKDRLKALWVKLRSEMEAFHTHAREEAGA